MLATCLWKNKYIKLLYLLLKTENSYYQFFEFLYASNQLLDTQGTV